MDERYPIGVTDSCAVAVLRHDGGGDGYGSWSATIGLRSGEATIRVPGHYAGVLAERLAAGAERFAPGQRLARDEIDELASLLAEAQTLIETLRQGLGLVPDSLPELL